MWTVRCYRVKGQAPAQALGPTTQQAVMPREEGSPHPIRHSVFSAHASATRSALVCAGHGGKPHGPKVEQDTVPRG